MIPIGVIAKRVIRDTGKSLLVSTDTGEFWLPKSAVENASAYQVGDRDVEMFVDFKFARENGWLRF